MLRRVLAILLAIAIKGWPRERQADLVREWNAELHVLESEPGQSAVVRAWRRLWFAGSLVLARRTGFGGFAGRVSEVERMVWHAVVLFCAPFVVAALVAVIDPLTALLVGSSPGTALATGVVARILVGAGVGVLLAVHLLRRIGDRVVRMQWRLLALVPLLAGTIAVGTAPASRGLRLSDSDGGLGLSLVGATALGMLLVPVVGLAAVAARRVRSGVVRIVLLGPTAAALALMSTAAVVWFSAGRPAWAAGRPWWWLGLLDGVEPGQYPREDHVARPLEDALVRLPGLLLASAAVAVVYAILTSRTRPHPAWGRLRAAGVGGEADRSPQPGRWWSVTLLAGAAYCAVAWAITLTYLTPHIGVSTMMDQEILPRGLLEPWPGWSAEEGRLWMQDMQLYGIVCTALCFLCAAAYRGLPLVPGLAGAGVLLMADIVIVRLGLFRLWVTPWLIGGSLLLGLFMWRYALRLGRANPTGGLRGRPLVASLSVLAAFLIPAPLSGWTTGGVMSATPPALAVVIVGLPTLLAVVAALGVVTTARTPLAGPVWILPVAVGSVTAAVAGLGLGAPWPAEMVGGVSRTLVAWLGLATALPLAAIACLSILSVLRNPLLLAPVVVGSVPLGGAIALVCMLGSMLPAQFLLAPMQYGQTYDGIAYLPGALVIGLLFAIKTRRYYIDDSTASPRARVTMASTPTVPNPPAVGRFW